MNTFEIIFTVINACFTCISVYCALRSAKQTEKQTALLNQQVEIARRQTDAIRQQVEAAFQQVKEASKQTEIAFKQAEEASKQTKIAQKQLEETYKSDYPTTTRLQHIANAIEKLDGTIKEIVNDK